MNTYEYECFVDKTAREYSKSHDVMTIVYEDGDNFGELAWCSEKVWDNMVDNRQVEPNWFKYSITA